MDIIKKYFPDLTTNQINQFQKLEQLYTDWNAKINVISRKDIDSLYEKHVLHSLGIAKTIHFKPETRILDVGTGGGFPLIPLAIMFPDSQFVGIDAIGKKIEVVNDIIAQLDLRNAKALKQRAQTVNTSFDFIVSRAVTKMPEFVSWIKGKIAKTDKNDLPNGVLYLKGGDLDDELATFPNAKVFSLNNYFEESFFETKKVVHLPL